MSSTASDRSTEQPIVLIHGMWMTGNQGLRIRGAAPRSSAHAVAERHVPVQTPGAPAQRRIAAGDEHPLRRGRRWADRHVTRVAAEAAPELRIADRDEASG